MTTTYARTRIVISDGIDGQRIWAEDYTNPTPLPEEVRYHLPGGARVFGSWPAFTAWLVEYPAIVTECFRVSIRDPSVYNLYASADDGPRGYDQDGDGAALYATPHPDNRDVIFHNAIKERLPLDGAESIDRLAAWFVSYMDADIREEALETVELDADAFMRATPDAPAPGPSDEDVAAEVRTRAKDLSAAVTTARARGLRVRVTSDNNYDTGREPLWLQFEITREL